MPDDRPTRRNSSLALERLRILVDQLHRQGRDQLPTERDLADEIGVGRRAVRRALEVLETEGRIWRRQGAGTFIGEEPARPEEDLRSLPDATNMLEVMEVRLRIEPALAQLAALRATPDDIVGMRQLAEKVAAADDMDGRELWDGALHRAVAAAAGNTLFLALFDVVDRVRQDDSWRHVREALRTQQTIERYKMQHVQILDAIERRDPVAAETLMRQHLLALQERLLFRTREDAVDAL
ncbi:GntR family transcriptional regulator [Breoghania corrubedonensis]|uniref:GntR family transcriptional regulator n=1 Tax=Breoghania corrubedonensis TaxID=665038 RepID=A0A2T5VA18_9HYPH|nr:FCD domain-containing protein [Breoghania corrubedonensis]PTW60598.1 GntR family transcriptional regulator [Breoghania corrubedonensis]